ncbi:MAG: mannosyltransferase family protein [Pyrinomonadaceae bacterium]
MANELQGGADDYQSQSSIEETRPKGGRLVSSRDWLRQLLARLPFAEVIRNTIGGRSARVAFCTFALTRIVIFIILVFTGQMRYPPDPFSQDIQDSSLSLKHVAVARILRQEAEVADVNWYKSIATGGYEREAFENTRHHNWAFFPLFPLLWRAASWLTGELLLTGMLLSNLFFLFALILLHKTALAFGLETAAADRTIFYLAIFPVSYFFALPLTESLFLLLTTGSLLSAKRERWWLAGLLGALASATRSTGVLLLPALAVLYWQTYRHFWPPRKSILALALIPAGLVSFMIYLHTITGNALAFKDALSTWGRTTGFFLTPLLAYLRRPWVIVEPWNPNFLNFGAATITIICGVVLLRRRAYALACYSLLAAFVALSSVLLQSQARYAMVVFPTFMVLATWGQSERVDTLIRTVSLVLLSLMTALFAAHFSIALS